MSSSSTDARLITSDRVEVLLLFPLVFAPVHSASPFLQLSVFCPVVQYLWHMHQFQVLLFLFKVHGSSDLDAVTFHPLFVIWLFGLSYFCAYKSFLRLSNLEFNATISESFSRSFFVFLVYFQTICHIVCVFVLAACHEIINIEFSSIIKRVLMSQHPSFELFAWCGTQNPE